MKKRLKIISGLFLLLLLWLIIHPEWVVYEAEINGKVIDQNGYPIENAEVSRIEEKHIKNNEFGYIESTEYKSETVKTDREGNFTLEEKGEIRWRFLFDLPFAYCYADFEVTKPGYKTYKTEFGDYEKYNETLKACKDVKFEPIVELIKN